MVLLRKGTGLLILFIIIGGLLGAVLGEVLNTVTPDSLIKNIFTTGYTLGINPPLTIDVRLFAFTIGLVFKVNLITLIGIFLGLYIYKQV